MRVPNQSAGVMRSLPATSLTGGAVRPSGFSPFPSGGLHYCYGWDEDMNRCRLYLGTREACAHLTPCPHFRSAGGGLKAIG